MMNFGQIFYKNVILIMTEKLKIILIFRYHRKSFWIYWRTLTQILIIQEIKKNQKNQNPHY